MSPAADPTRPFGLADDDFWSAPFRTRDAVSDRLSGAGFTGLVIDAPARAVLDGRAGLPVVGLHRVSFRDEKTQRFTDRAVVAAVRLEDGQVWADLVEAPEPEDDSAPPPEEDEADPGEGFYTSNFRIDLCERLGVPRLPGSTFVVRVLLGPIASNAARIELARPRAAFVDPAVEEAAAALAAERRPAPVDPPAKEPLPSYVRGPLSPKLPDQGPALVLARPLRAPGGGLVVRGAFRAPVRARDLVRPTEEGAPLDVGDPAATAVVPVTLLLLGERFTGPYRLDLRVPLHEPVAAGAPGTGFFAVDVLAALGKRTRQRYHLYAVCGDLLAGPHELELR
jgi:hypothetical protein